eukprot:TRINITY_DN51520_c0_g1_i1.p1 TRINITY_DN51520_c0_g1~~TRINITY_DN51520_c0_g1_i1.p1  ORF type:complete len:203 (+),score=38.56 TRINITY_DN51520_c0_g1_i1:32-610(+)
MGRKRHALGEPGPDTVFEQAGDPLLSALFESDTEAAQCLIQSGSDIEVVDHMGWRPLHRACFAGFGSIVGLLLEKRADPSATDTDGLQPLHVATAGGHLDCCKELLAARADPTVPDGYAGMTAQMHALTRDGELGEALQKLLGAPDLSLFDDMDDMTGNVGEVCQPCPARAKSVCTATTELTGQAESSHSAE